ncbi:hypothetical protein NS220_16545 [Microbacterium testaceum]|uniref:Uncharacterized protein n=1 Tax=Microbacterium testaceum TaxID=2033 RepID=A0A147ET78_MICTE|nr:hypothetical protein NS220_16545 [Microbacterium testaceum]
MAVGSSGAGRARWEPGGTGRRATRGTPPRESPPCRPRRPPAPASTPRPSPRSSSAGRSSSPRSPSWHGS